ncbi:MAG: Hsp20/alpha crystallin family protein [Methylococcaceae bacterium]|nr:Hsp20/alpha crystallin family protein [Methylococcaceae bacterium]
MNAENKEVATQESTAEEITLTPDTDIYESKEGVTLFFDLPGVSKETLDIDVDQDILTIKGKIDLTTAKNMQPTYIDVRANVFERRFTLGDELDSSQIVAKLDQGALKLSIPRLEKHQPKKINIKVA